MFSGPSDEVLFRIDKYSSRRGAFHTDQSRDEAVIDMCFIRYRQIRCAVDVCVVKVEGGFSLKMVPYFF